MEHPSYLCAWCSRKWDTPPPVRDNPAQTPSSISKLGQLSLIPPSDSLLIRSNLPIATSWLLKLPNELLGTIVAMATQTSNSQDPPNYDDLLAIAFVCKRLNWLATPLLYHTIDFTPNYMFKITPPSDSEGGGGCPVVPACYPARCFYRTMKETPALQSLCKVLKVEITEYDFVQGSLSDRYILANDLISRLPNVQSLTIKASSKAEINQRIYAFIKQAAVHMPMLENFELDLRQEEAHGIHVNDLIQNLTMPNLKVLTLHGIHGSSRYDWRLDVDNYETFQPITENYKGTASFTSLTIRELYEYDHLNDIKPLLSWPKSLEHLHLEETPPCALMPAQKHSYIQQFLQPYQATLKTLCLGYRLEKGLNRCIDLASFPNLERLTLVDTTEWCTPSLAATKLLGPKLQAFSWDLALDLSNNSWDWYVFSSKQENWICDFAEHAVLKKAALKHILVKVQAQRWRTVDDLRKFKLIWDNMDRLADELERIGIRFEYSPPRTDLDESDYHAIGT